MKTLFQLFFHALVLNNVLGNWSSWVVNSMPCSVTCGPRPGHRRVVKYRLCLDEPCEGSNTIETSMSCRAADTDCNVTSTAHNAYKKNAKDDVLRDASNPNDDTDLQDTIVMAVTCCGLLVVIGLIMYLLSGVFKGSTNENANILVEKSASKKQRQDNTNLAFELDQSECCCENL